MKRKVSIVLALAGVLAVVGGAALVFGQEETATRSASANLPLRTAADAKPLETTMMNGVKEFELTAEPILWQYGNGKSIEAWAYNGQVPGPEIRVKQGDRVRIVLTNKLPKATSLHWHGLDVPNSEDGVPGVTQPAVEPGQTRVYEFTVTNGPGTHFYHTHGSGGHDEAAQMDAGLSGAFIVEPKDGLLNVDLGNPADEEYTMVLDDWQKGEGSTNKALEEANMDMSMDMSDMPMDDMNSYNLFTINGLAFPDTKPLSVKAGEKVRVRLINASSMSIHPMHLHGHQFTVMAQDGNELPAAQRYQRNTITLNPGETYDIEFTANNDGTWAFHCHELHHAGSGMVTVLKYDGAPTPPPSDSGMEMGGGSGGVQTDSGNGGMQMGSGTMTHNMSGM